MPHNLTNLVHACPGAVGWLQQLLDRAQDLLPGPAFDVG